MIFSEFQMEKRVNRKPHDSQRHLTKIDSKLLLNLFPFGLILDHEMKIVGAGEKIIDAWSNSNGNKGGQALLGAPLADYFKLCRPKGIAFNWENVKNLQTVLFEIEMLRGNGKDSAKGQKSSSANTKSVDPDIDTSVAGGAGPAPANNGAPKPVRRGSQGLRSILLKGQMRFIKEIDGLIFLCSPL